MMGSSLLGAARLAAYVAFTLPLMETPGGWAEILNTAHPAPRTVRQGKVSLVAHSLMLLRHERPR